MRGLQATAKRQERAARKRYRELERLAKEASKLSALEQARLEVAASENALELLLSVHKEQNQPIDWPGLASWLPPCRPFPKARHKLATFLSLASSLGKPAVHSAPGRIAGAIAADEHDYQAEVARYDEDIDTWQWLQGLSQRVLVGDISAYEAVVAHFSPLSEISSLGSTSSISVHGPTLISCELHVNGRDVVPTELKSLTSTGKLSVKAMPKARFHEIYQDYVCGCALRVGRELFAILPVDTVLVTARVSRNDASEGLGLTVAVLSVALTRDACSKLDFERIDASDTVAMFLHRGDVMASKKTGEFVPITPLLPSDVAASDLNAHNMPDMRLNVRVLRRAIRELLLLPPLEDASADAAPGASHDI